MAIRGRYISRSRKVKYHPFNNKHKAENTESGHQDFKSQSLPPVIYFQQQVYPLRTPQAYNPNALGGRAGGALGVPGQPVYIVRSGLASATQRNKAFRLLGPSVFSQTIIVCLRIWTYG